LPVCQRSLNREHVWLYSPVGRSQTGGVSRAGALHKHAREGPNFLKIFLPSGAQSYFPEPIRLVLLLKPEGVLQRAIEYGYYRGLLDANNDKFKVSSWGAYKPKPKPKEFSTFC